MKRVKLKTLKFDNHTIEFKEGINYITGINSSGKTTIFKLIQYILGIRRDLGFYSSFIKGDQASIEILIDEKAYLFLRSFTNREVIISSIDADLKFVVGSLDFNRYLINILNPDFNFELSESFIVQILKESFISENTDLKFINNTQREAKWLLMGINLIYPKKIKTYLKDLEIQVKQQEIGFSNIESYRSDVEFYLKKEFPEKKVEVSEILESNLRKYDEKLRDAINVYEQSKALLLNILEENSLLFQEKINQLNPLFRKHLKDLFIDDRFSINDIFEGDFKGRSYGEMSLIKLIFEISLQSSYKITNGIGLIINDAGLLHIDHHRTVQFRNFISSLVQEIDFQYVEFVSNPIGIEKTDIIFDTTKNLRYV